MLIQKNSVGVNKNAGAGNFGKAFAHNGPKSYCRLPLFYFQKGGGLYCNPLFIILDSVVLYRNDIRNYGN